MSACIEASSIQLAVDAVMAGRQSIRAFLPKPAERSVIEDILQAAARAPSGTNTQPWKVYVLAGAARDRLVEAACAVYDADPEHYEHTYDAVYRDLDREPYLTRQRTLGKALYGLLGIPKGDTAAMLAQRRRNFTLFDAPVGLMVTVEKSLGSGSWMDCGMFMQNVMLAARARGLDTCPQAYWVVYESVVKQVVGWPDSERLVSGISLGYADPDAPENRLVSERADLSEFVVFQE